MDRKAIEEEISTLEDKIEKLRVSKPAHDFTGTYKMELLELEDELQAKKKRIRDARTQ